jgi:hypothetical protein
VSGNLQRCGAFVGAYDPADRVAAGGGNEMEGEDIDILEVPIAKALAMMQRGEICDAKTIMLLQYAALHLFPEVAGSEADRTAIQVVGAA